MAGLAQQPPCPRRYLREVIGCGERAFRVPGPQCRLGLSSGDSGSTQRLVRAGCYACEVGQGGGPGVLLRTQVLGVWSLRVLGSCARRGDRGTVRQREGVRTVRSWRLIEDVAGCPSGGVSGALSVAAPAGPVFVLRIISVIPLVTFRGAISGS
jgi:hypothetical protein